MHHRPKDTEHDIAVRADDIALSLYGIELEDLPSTIQSSIFNTAYTQIAEEAVAAAEHIMDCSR